MSLNLSPRSRRVFATVSSLAMVGAGLVALSSPAQAAPQTVDYSGLPYVYVVPAGVTSLNVTVNGAQGSDAVAAGGKGAQVTGTINVTPGEALQVNVGGAGGFELAGWNGGGQFGPFGYGGGGATDIRRGSCAWSGACDLSKRIVIAAGGGGAGQSAGGNGGLVGVNGGNTGTGSTGGQGATASAGGAGGTSVSSSSNGGAGVLGQGGAGAPGLSASGGGGGLYGGGGSGGQGPGAGSGPGNAGGGGGSSLAPAGTTVSGTLVSGNGSVVFDIESAGYSGQQTFTGSPATYTVPAGVTKVRAQVYGAGGGRYSGSNAVGGKGGAIDAPLAVTGGEVLELRVGSRGGDIQIGNPAGGAGGWNGGGAGGDRGGDMAMAGSGGGGASDIRRCGTPGTCGVSDIIAAAGGGGGATYYFDGGVGGGEAGGAGVSGGGGGTQNAGGAGGNAGDDNAGESGSQGLGGAGGDGEASSGGGGPLEQPGSGGSGGGGGWYGGGGGQGGTAEMIPVEAGAGGGGSSLVPEGGATTAGGGSVDDGWILISVFLNPPSDLSATPDDTTVSLTWNAPDTLPDTGELTGYRMQRTTNPSDPDSWEDTTVQPVGTATSMTETGLTNGTEYSFRVIAINGAGDSDPSNVAAATPNSGPPAPTDVTAEVTAANELNVSWTVADPEPNEGYKVYYSTNPSGPFTTEVPNGTCSSVTSGATTSCTATGLDAGTEYYFAIASVDSSETGNPSTPGSGTPIEAPNPPTIDSTPVQGNNSLTVNWTIPAETAGRPLGSFRLLAKKNSESTYSVVTTGSCAAPIDKAESVCTLSDLTPGDEYQFIVESVNSVGDAASSPSDSIEVISAPPAPSVTGVEPVEGTGKVKVTWQAGTGEPEPTSYVVYRATSESGPYDVVTTGPCAEGVVGNAVECVDEGLTPGQTYFYKIAGKNGSVEGEKSAASEGVEALQPPAAPNKPTGVPKGTGGIELTWTDPAPSPGATAEEWLIEMTTNGGTTWEEVPASSLCDPIASPCHLTGLEIDTPHQFRVKAKNRAGVSTESDASDEITPVVAPAAPTDVAVSQTSGTEKSLTVEWTAPSGSPDSYTVYISENEEGPFTTAATCVTGGTSPTASPCQIDGLVAGTKYYVQVSATKSGVEGTNSTTVDGTAIDRPAQPGVPTAEVTGSLEMTLSWEPNSSTAAPVSEYEVLMEDDSDPGNWVPVPGGTCLTAPEPGCTITGLTDGKSYSYKVVPKNVAGTGAESAVSEPVQAYSTPGEPTGLEITNPTSGTAHVQWTAPSGSVDGYKVYRATSSSGPWTEIESGSCATVVSGTSCDDENLEDGKYFYKVEAVRGVLTSPASDVESIDVYTTVGVPSIATLTPGQGKVTVTVAKGSGGTVKSYVVTAEPGGKTCTISTPAKSCTISGLTNGKNYTFTAVAKNPLGQSESSPVAGPVTPTNPQAAKPGKPRDVRIKGGSKAKSIHVSWKAPSNPRGDRTTAYYRITLNLDRCSRVIMTKKLGKNVTNYTFKRSWLLKKRNSTCSRLRGEVANKNVRYRVSIEAFNSQGGGPVSKRSFVVRR